MIQLDEKLPYLGKVAELFEYKTFPDFIFLTARNYAVEEFFLRAAYHKKRRNDVLAKGWSPLYFRRTYFTYLEEPGDAIDTSSRPAT
jgi:hypothetical protein